MSTELSNLSKRTSKTQGPDKIRPLDDVFEDSSADTSLEPKPKSPLSERILRQADRFDWVKRNWTWSKVKPVIRCAIVAFGATVLFVIPAVERFLGSASFLLLIASFLSPASEPFIATLERELIILFLVAVAWAWVCLGLFCANLARNVRVPSATLLDAISGRYIEAAPTVILAVFLFVGSAFFLYLKVRQGPGPYLFACIFACICLNISLTTGVLFPWPFYLIGRSIILPLILYSALALIGTLTIFPSTISAQFTTRLQDALSPLIQALEAHQSLLKTSTTSETFPSKAKAASALLQQCEASLVPLAASARLLRSDLIYCRFSPLDFRSFHDLARRLIGRAHGMNSYFALIDPSQSRFPNTPGPSVPPTPDPSSPTFGSRNASLERTGLSPNHLHSKSTDLASGKKTPPEIEESLTPSTSRRSHHRHHHAHHHILHHSLLTLTKSRGRKHEHTVGTFESQRYLDLESSHFLDPHAEESIARAGELLQESCEATLKACQEGLTEAREWLGTVRQNRFTWWKKREGRKQELQNRIDGYKCLRDRISGIIDEFRNEKRHLVLEPYQPAFEHRRGDEKPPQIPQHRYLFNCYVYQYHLIQISCLVIEMLNEIISKEEERPRCVLWTPVATSFKWNQSYIPEEIDRTDDDDPDVIQRTPADHSDERLLGGTRARHPDALLPSNTLEWILARIYHALRGLGGGNLLFALKAGIFTVLLCLPFFFKSSVTFAYENRFTWAIFMGQLTLARFRGDTAFGLINRIISTFFGGLTGMVMWYISTGSGGGNAIGLVAVSGVCFPFFYFVRLYCPIPPLTNIVFFVTAALVVGYSYQDQQLPSPGSAGFGWSVAWRRFVLVAVGVVAAFLVSFLPPSTTIRLYHRNLLATTSSELASIYCDIISFAHTKQESQTQDIIANLIAVRAKLKRSIVLKTNLPYEYSLQGRWPAQRYQQLVDLQLAISYSLSHLLSVLKHMEPNWARAFLRRTRFMDPDFQGDILAVFSMVSSSLRTGSALPQITPSPLLDRFMYKYHGLNVIHKDAEDDYGLPRSLSLETLQNEQYLMFCVGISTAFGIVNRIDRLMFSMKEIVGEQYHIEGMAANVKGDMELGVRTSAVNFEPPKGV